MQQQLFFHPDTQKHQLTDPNIEDIMYNLDAFYAMEKLRLGSEMRSREKVLNNKQYQIKLLEEVQQAFDVNDPLSQNVLFKAYQQILELQRNVSDKNFQRLKETLRSIDPKTNRSELQNILVHLLNFSIRQINRGDQKYLEENLHLYRIGLELNLLIENNRITGTTFSNIVASGIRNEVFEWVEDFIQNYQDYLEEGLRPNVKTLCMGLLYYSQGKQDQAIDLIINFGFTDDFYQLRAKTLMLRSIYERFLSDESFFNLLSAQSQAFEKFLRRNHTIGKKQYQRTSGFCTTVAPNCQYALLEKVDAQIFKEKGTANQKGP